MREQYIPKIKSPEETREIRKEALFGFLGIRDSAEDREQVESSIKALHDEIEKSPKAGRMIEQNKAQRNEFVIPVVSSEQREKILEHLFDLGIFPWEESGLLIVDKKHDLEKLQLAGIARGTAYQEERKVSEVSAGKDVEEGMYQFPLPQPLPKEKRSVRKEEVQPVSIDDEELEPGVDTELLEIIQKFDAGIIDEEDTEFQAVFGDMPTLTLFPRKYTWNGKEHVHARTGEVITQDDEMKILAKAQSGDARAMNEFVRLNTGFVIYFAKKVKDRLGGDIDELFQEGLLGLEYAMRKFSFEHESGAKFSSYAAECVEGYMRSGLRQSRNDIILPANTKRREVYKLRRAEDKKRQLLGPEYDDDLDNQDYLQEIARLERRLLIGAQFDPIESHFNTSVWEKTDFRGRDAVADGEQQEQALDQRNLKAIITKMMMTLTPREERVLRLRFGLADMSQVVMPGLNPGERIDSIGIAEGLTLEEVGHMYGMTPARIRQIEAKALRKLKHPARGRILERFLPERLAATKDNKEEETMFTPTNSFRMGFESERISAGKKEQEGLENWLTPEQLAEGFGVSKSEIQGYLDKYKQSHPIWFRSVGEVANGGAYIQQYVSKDIIRLIETPATAENDYRKLSFQGEFDSRQELPIWVEQFALAQELHMDPVDLALLAMNYRSTNPEWFGKINGADGKKVEWYSQQLAEELRRKVKEDK